MIWKCRHSDIELFRGIGMNSSSEIFAKVIPESNYAVLYCFHHTVYSFDSDIDNADLQTSLKKAKQLEFPELF